MKLARTITVISLLLAAAGCGRNPTPPGLIMWPGTYASPNGQYELAVSVTGNGIVDYTIRDAATSQRLRSDGGFSTVHRWFLFWDSRNRLWSYNSDTGPFAVWSDSGGGFAMAQIDASSPFLTSMSNVVYDDLPDSLKRLLKIDSGWPGIHTTAQQSPAPDAPAGSSRWNRIQPQAPGQPTAGLSAASSVPAGRITMDGRAEDWDRVAIRWTQAPGERVEYGVRRIKFARDDQNLFVLLELTRGIRQRFDRLAARGSYRSGAIGHLRLQIGECRFTVWIPTGVHSVYDNKTGQRLSAEPIVNYELLRATPQSDQSTCITDRGSRQNPGFIAFSGTYLEMWLPLGELEMNAQSPVQISLDEM